MRKKILMIMAAYLAITYSYSQNGNKYDSFAVPIKVKPGAQLSKSIEGNITPNRVVTCEMPDVRIFPSNVPQSEVHISINKLNNQSLLVSSNTFPIGNSFQGAYWSNNSGTNWQGADILPNNAFGRGDPSTAYDALGRGYIASMAPNATTAPNGLFIQRTNNNGATWQPQVNATGVINGFDKDMIAADDVPTSPFANNLYCTWTVFGGTTSVQFNRSINGGTTFSAPITLRNGFGQGANVQTGPNGEVYVCWADYTNGNLPAQGLGFTRSINGGVAFTPFTIPFNYSGIRVASTPNPNFNNTRVNDFPSMAVDKSNSPRRGRIYIVYAERENGNGKSIIRLRWSDNQGTNWSVPTTLSIPTARQSWMPWVSVDDTNGNVFVTYFCMENQNNFNTNTYVAASINGFATFQNRIVSDVLHVTAPIPAFQGGYAGDYIGITANGGRGFAAWMDDRNGTWQNYVSEVRVADIEITGSSSLCTSNTYTLTGVPAGAIVTWQPPTPAGIVTMTTSGNTATLTSSGSASGVVTLAADVTEATCPYGLIAIPITVGGVQNSSNIVLTGNPLLCTSNTYTITGVPIGATLTWQPPTPAGIVTMTTSGNTATLTSNGSTNASVTLSATITQGACSWVVAPLNVIVGTQNPANIVGLTPPIGVSPGELLELEADNPSMLSYNWSVEGGSFVSLSDQFHVTIQVDQCPPNINNGYLNVHLSYLNGCGTGNTYTEWTTVDCGTGGGAFRVSPNPSNGILTVDGQLQNKRIKEIIIADKIGNVKRQVRYSGNDSKVTIDVSSLPQDIYYLKVFDGKAWSAILISIKR
jgi:Secretion system C-terminal sorting domain